MCEGRGDDAVRAARRRVEAIRYRGGGGRDHARGRARRGARAAGAERQRQDDAAAAAGGLRAGGRGPHDHRRSGCRRALARAAALRHGVSALRLISAPRRGRERRVRLARQEAGGTGDGRAAGRRGVGARRSRGLRAAPGAGAVGRAAAARGAGARARPRATRAAARRAPVEPRPGAARAHAPRAAPAHQARRDHDPLRDPRAGGGLRPGRPRRGARRGAARPGRDPGRSVRAPGEPLRRGARGVDVRRGARVTPGTRRGLPGALLTLLLAWLVLYPILVVVAEAARGDAIAVFLSRGGEWHALWASLWISLASVALAAAVGVPLAFLFEWLRFPRPQTPGSGIAPPPLLPPVVGVIA